MPFRTTWRWRSSGDKIAAIGPTDTVSQDVSQRRGLRRARQGALPGTHQLSRPPRGDARAWLQRGLRIPQLRAPGRPARQPSSGRRGHADGHRRRAGSAADRAPRPSSRIPAASAAPPRRWRRPACAACSRSRSATARTWRARCRRRGSAASADAPLLAEAARRRPAAHQRPVHHVARREAGTHHASSRPPRSPRTSSPELLKAVRAFAEKHDLGYTIHLSQSRAEVDFMVRHHGASAAGVSRQARLPRPAAVRGALPIRRRRRYRDARPLGHHHFAPGGHGREPRRHPAHRRAARRRLSDRQRHRQQHQRSVRGDAGRPADGTNLAATIRFPACGRSRKTCSRTPRREARARCGRDSSSARSRSGRRPTCWSWTRCAPTSCRRGASCRRGSTTVSQSDIESVMVDGQFVMRNRKVLTMDEDAHRRRSRQGRAADLEHRCRPPGPSACRAGRAAIEHRSSTRATSESANRRAAGTHCSVRG